MELVKYKPPLESELENQYYWLLDENGIFLESRLYQSKRTAYIALASNNIEWDIIEFSNLDMGMLIQIRKGGNKWDTY